MRNMHATAIKIIVSCVVVTIKALENRFLSMVKYIRYGLYTAKIEKKYMINTTF